jgi:hypothetical protein
LAGELDVTTAMLRCATWRSAAALNWSGDAASSMGSVTRTTRHSCPLLTNWGTQDTGQRTIACEPIVT